MLKFKLPCACVARADTCVQTRTFALNVQKSVMETKTAQTAMTKFTVVSEKIGLYNVLKLPYHMRTLKVFIMDTLH